MLNCVIALTFTSSVLVEPSRNSICKRLWSSKGCGAAHRVRRSSLGCGAAQIVVRWLAVRKARVRIPARHPREALYWAKCNEETSVDPRRMYEWMYCTIFDPALLDLEVAIAKNVVYFPRNENTRGGGGHVTAGLWLWKWGELISRISAPIFFPVFSYPFLDRFFTYTTRRFQRRTFIVS